ncbi:MAG: aldo/keto reductase [Azospirillaceae bacterium]|nr:aldo/keto reductase [Azospirillaceae bacterium]
MEHRELGRSGLKVPPLCFGGNVFGWTADEARSFALLDALVEAGLNFIDTADVYSRWVPGHTGGESETIIGRWLAKRGRRDDVVIATKVGMDMGEGKTGLSARRIRQAVDESLARLNTDYIDLYQSHSDDQGTPLEETLGAYDALIKAGKVRAIGASNYSAARLSQALEVSAANGLPRYETLQPLYNLVERPAFEGELEQVCLTRKVGVIPFFSLASGFLTGKYRSKEDAAGKARARHVEKYLNDHGFRVVAALDTVGARHGAKPAAVALAWLMAKPAITAPIASATSVEQLADLVAATRLTLDTDAIAELDAASAPA